MTRDEILALKPGPELDDLVAEKVMGWHSGTPNLGAWRLHSDGEWWRTKAPPTVAVKHKTLFRPSTNIAAAMSVAEHMAKTRNMSLDLKADTLKAGSAPLSICRAALLAVTQSAASPPASASEQPPDPPSSE